MTLRGVGHVVNYAIGTVSETKQYLKEKREAGSAEEDGMRESSSAAPRTSDPSGSLSSDKPDSREINDTEDLPDGSLFDSDNEDWELDEKAGKVREQEMKVRPPSYENATQQYKEENDVGGMLGNNDCAVSDIGGCRDTPLPVPIILPQRRPQHRTRGYSLFHASSSLKQD